MIKFSVLFLIIVCFVGCHSPKPEKKEQTTKTVVTESVRARIDSVLKSNVDSERIAGVSALIFEKNTEVYFNAFGYADRESNIPMDRNTVVQIFSMTKPVTGVALMQLYEKGAFELDDPLAKYIPEFADIKVFSGVDSKGKIKLEPPKRPITIRDLTRHTAGFAREEDPYLGTMVKEADVRNKENTLTQMVKKLSKLPLAFHPGEQWCYGLSVDVQAYLVEKFSGKSFDEYVNENIFKPLGMSSTGYVPKDVSKLAAMYRKAEDGQLNRVPDEEAKAFNSKPWPMKPGGFGLTSTLDDYMKFTQMLLNRGTINGATILKEETVRLMSTNQLSDSITKRMWLPSKGRVGFGIDFAVRVAPAKSKEEKVGAVGEFFWDGAPSTLFWVDPKNELTAVLFVQIYPFDNDLHKDFRDAVYGSYDDE
jgi:CubicO group peptidase (beta-lactamase class C family)